MAFEKELPQWKEKGVKPPQSKLDEGWKVQDKPPAAWLNWQMNKTYEALKEVQEKAAEKTGVSSAIEDAKKYTDQKVKDIDLSKITTESIGAAKKVDFDTLKKEAVSRKSDIFNDFNQYTEPGIYNITTMAGKANVPNNFRGASMDWGILTVASTPQGYIEQKYTCVVNNMSQRRVRTEARWTSWKALIDEVTFQDAIYLPPNTDLNNIIVPGEYMNPSNAEVATMANVPTAESFSLSVYKHAGVQQVFRDFSPYSAKVWKRNFYVDKWSRWIRVLDENDYNELKQSGVDAKNRIAGAVNAKGVPASANDDFATLATKIGQIKTGLKSASGNTNYATKVEINNLDFEPVIVLINLKFNFRFYDVYSSNGRVQGYFIKGESNSAYTQVDIYATRQTYFMGDTDIEWLPRGFVLKSYPRNAGDVQNTGFEITNWTALGI